MSTNTPTSKPRSLRRLVQRDGAARIQAYQEYCAKHCVTDADMRRTIRKSFPAGMKFQRAKYKVGDLVEGTMWPGIYLVAGYGFTGSHGQERGCVGFKITDRIHRKWQWIGPDKTLQKYPLNAQVRDAAPTNNATTEG